MPPTTESTTTTLEREGDREMMGSEYSGSGCESGWTMYLEHSMNPSLRDTAAAFLVDEHNGNHHISNNQRWTRRRTHHDMEQQPQQEEDNLSMLSDASSPNLHDHQHSPVEEEEQKSTQPHHHHHQNINYESHFLDDTATSHVIMDFFPNYNGYIPTNNTTPPTPTDTFLQYPSHGFFQTDFDQGSSAFQHQLGFSITQPPTPSSQQLHTHQWFGGIR